MTPTLAEVAPRNRYRKVVALTGAGISAAAGLATFRGIGGLWTARPDLATAMESSLLPGNLPVLWDVWGGIRRQAIAAGPSPAHLALARAQVQVITQNVDGLHQAAGARDVVELHGALDRVVCLGCRATPGRTEIQQRLTALNPGFGAPASAINPDGDAELPDAELDRFTMAACPSCGDGPLKPDVVFFGESVPRPRVDHCFGLVEGARSLVVLGSSLTVMSGLRFVHAATRRGLPVAVVTAGPSRADAVATVRLVDGLGDVLPGVLDTLGLPDRA